MRRINKPEEYKTREQIAKDLRDLSNDILDNTPPDTMLKFYITFNFAKSEDVIAALNRGIKNAK